MSAREIKYQGFGYMVLIKNPIVVATVQNDKEEIQE